MGFFFRKSLGVLGGLFRLNFSKKGIGISTGIKGARFVIGPAGTYVHLGRNGFYYKKYLGKESSKSKMENNYLAQDQVPSTNEIPQTHITVNFDKITDSESQEFVNELQKKENRLRFYKVLGFYPLFIIIPVLLFALSQVLENKIQVITENIYEDYVIIDNEIANLRDKPSTSGSNIIYQAKRGDKFLFISETNTKWLKIHTPNHDSLFVNGNLARTSNELIETMNHEIHNPETNRDLLALGIISIGLICWNILLLILDRRRKTVNLVYEVDDIVQDLQKLLHDSFEIYYRSHKKWQIIDTVLNTNLKYSGGAGILNDRVRVKQVSMHKLPTPFFRTNIKIPFMRLYRTEYFFLPDMLLLKRNNNFAAIQYDTLTVKKSDSRFIEDSSLPSDAEVIDYTYKYLNKDGSPDRRFSHNPQLPICNYSEYHFTSNEGINAIILTSMKGAMDNFVSVLELLAKIERGQDSIQEILHKNNN